VIVRTATTWALAHGLPRLALRRAARQGELIAAITTDPRLRDDPFDAYDTIRGQGPLVHGRLVSATASYAVANRVLRSDAFSVTAGHATAAPFARLLAASLDPRALGPIDPPSLLAIDPPEHTRLRRLVAKPFTARTVAAIAPRVAQIADELLDGIVASGVREFDLVDAYAALLPVTVIAEILGVPTDMRAEYLEWGNRAAVTLDPGLSWRVFHDADRAIRQLHNWLDEHIAELRRHPGDDLLSQLATADGAERLTDTELRVTALLLIGAGFETTVNVIGNGVRLLVQHPDQLACLLADPAGWDNAVEEVLRYDSPVQVTLRIATRETEVDGARVPAGRPVLVMLGGANRDPAVFDDPNRFDVARSNAREHLSFSAGVHYCLGAQLARIEGATALRRLFERFPDLALAGEPTRRTTRVLRGYEHLPVDVGFVGPGAPNSPGWGRTERVPFRQTGVRR
jgi:cytochrome P450